MILLGGGGHALSAIDVIEAWGQEPVQGIVDDTPACAAVALGFTYLGTDSQLEFLSSRYSAALVTLGQIRSSFRREAAYSLLTELGFTSPTVVSPYSRISPRSEVGEGTLICHGVVLNSGGVVRRNCIINTGAILEHGSFIEDHCHISTGAIVNGEARIGSGSFIGSGAVVREGLRIGRNCVVGAGVTVFRDCPAETTIRAS